MNEVQVKLTVLFDGTFWIGIFERKMGNKLEVSKFIFGAEPKDIEIYNFILYKYKYLKFSDPVIIDKKQKVKVNPKRMKKLVKKQVVNAIGTKSQQALKKQQEENKVMRKKQIKVKKETQKQLKFELRQKKKLQQHKGK